MNRALTSLIVLVISSSLAYSAHGHDEGRASAGSSWSKQRGSFAAMVLLSNEPDEFLNAWHNSTDDFPFQMSETAVRGAPIVAFVLFGGCEPDDDGLCNAAVDFTVLNPDGTEYVTFKDKDLWRDKPAIPAGAVQLSTEYMGVIIEPDDPLGQYEIQVAVRDNNAGITLHLSKTFTATEP